MNFSNIKSIEIPQGVVKQITTSQGVVLWQAQTGPTDYSKRYLTLVARDSGTLQFAGTSNSSITNNIQYSTDNGQTWSTAAQNVSVNVNNGDKVLWKGEMSKVSTQGIGNFTSSTASFDIEGNIMSLIYGDNFIEQVSLAGKTYLFNGLFKATKCVNTTNLVLAATTLSSNCYQQMFYNCTSLTTAPTLPATTLLNCSNCYESMFEGCSSLTSSPQLPATILSNYCYQRMFSGCTSLISSPTLPATTFNTGCYAAIFNNTNVIPDCNNIDFTNVTVIQSGVLTKLFEGTKVTDNILRNILPINQSTNHYYLPVTTLSKQCYMGMFTNCTYLTTAPELPATTLAQSCYASMFYGCTSLNNITMLATDISASGCLSDWVKNVSATGTFVKNPSMSSLPTGNSGVPNGWTVTDAT